MKKLFAMICSLMLLTLFATTTVSAQNLTGDFRYRYETAETAQGEADTSAVRLRVGTSIKINEKVDLNIRLNTDDQYLSGVGASFILLDVVSVDYRINNNINFTLGKMLNPFYTPGNSELLLDENFNLEGVSIQTTLDLSNGMECFINGSYTILTENVTTDDITMQAIQAGLDFDLGGACITLGGGYYLYPDFTQDLENFQLFAEVSGKVVGAIVTVYNDYVVNNLHDVDDLGTSACLVGSTIKINKVLIGYSYRDIDGATLLLTDGDFLFGKGHEVSGGYELSENVTITASYQTTKNVDADAIRGELVLKF